MRLSTTKNEAGVVRAVVATVATVALVAGGRTAAAAPVTYGNVGTPATYVPIHASVTGDLIGTMIVNGGGGEDKVLLFDETTGRYSGYGLDNRTTPIGGTFNFGPVNAGDLLSFQIWNSDDQGRVPGLISATDPSVSQDGVTHAFVSTDGTFVYLSTEDLSVLGGGTDYNYNDLIFALSASQVLAPGAVAATPEPASLALVGTGLLGAMGAVRRRFQQ